MGRNKLEIGNFSRRIVAVLTCKAREQGLSDRALVLKAGITETRGRAVLNSERAMTVDELETLSLALGLVPWQVVREAETSLETSL